MIRQGTRPRRSDMKSGSIRIALAFALATAAGGGSMLVPQSHAAARDNYLQLAARGDDDPSLPINTFTARPRPPAPAPKPTVPPFALPTAPISVAPARTEPAGPAGPGGSEIPPYAEELLRLSEILGAIHYLRGLCGAEEGQLWRLKMEELLAVEAPKPTWRARLVERFNEGYRGFDRTYRQCTPSAVEAIDLYVAEGRGLTLTIKSRYAN
jgi:uncharacterized protein (TIGR02301 family)